MADAKLVEELKTKHGELHELSAPSGETVIVATPSKATWKRFQSQIHDERRRADAIEGLVRACIVHPANGDVELMLDRRPGLVETFGKVIVELGGAGQEVQKKAL